MRVENKISGMTFYGNDSEKVFVNSDIKGEKIVRRFHKIICSSIQSKQISFWSAYDINIENLELFDILSCRGLLRCVHSHC